MLEFITIMGGTLAFIFVQIVVGIILLAIAKKGYARKIRGCKIKFKHLTKEEKEGFKDSENLESIETFAKGLDLMFLIAWVVWLITIIF